MIFFIFFYEEPISFWLKNPKNPKNPEEPNLKNPKNPSTRRTQEPVKG